MEKNAFDQYKTRIAEASKVLGLSEQEITSLETPDRILEKELSVTVEDKKIIYPSYRVQFSNARDLIREVTFLIHRPI